MVSFSLRQRISYPLLEDPTPVSFHLSQFAPTPTFPQWLDVGRGSPYPRGDMPE